MFNLSSTESFIVVDLNINPDPEETQPHSTPIPNFQTIDSKKANESEITEEKVEKQFDPCNDNPCQNEGVCQVKDGQVVCLCLKDFAGDHCESKLGHNSSYSAASIFRSSILWSVFSLAKTQRMDAQLYQLSRLFSKVAYALFLVFEKVFRHTEKSMNVK